jgi:hypothetical protein
MDYAIILDLHSGSKVKKHIGLNPDFAVATYCGLKNFVATLVSRF